MVSRCTMLTWRDVTRMGPAAEAARLEALLQGIMVLCTCCRPRVSPDSSVPDCAAASWLVLQQHLLWCSIGEFSSCGWGGHGGCLLV